MIIKLFGGLLGVHFVGKNLMDMMQNLCQKHALTRPHVVSSTHPHKKALCDENLANRQDNKTDLLCWFSPSLYAPMTCAEEGGDFFCLARGITKPHDSPKAEKARKSFMQEPCQTLFT